MGNKRYQAAKYTVEITVSKPLNMVFEKLICLAAWWPEDFKGEPIKLNSEFVFSSGDSHYSKNKVIELVPNEKLVWLTLESIRKTDNYDWSGTKFIFELSNDNQTNIQFTYDGTVFEGEYDRLVQICDITIKDMFYNYILSGKKK